MWNSIENLPWIATVAGSLLTGGGFAQLVTALNSWRRGDNAHTRESHAQLLGGLTEMAAAAKDDAAAARTRARLLDDYAQDLREHISSGLAPPPPDWPEGL